MVFKVSEVKRTRTERLFEEEEEEEEEEEVPKKIRKQPIEIESVELEPSVSPEKLTEEQLSQFWKESALASQFRPITLSPLGIDVEDQFEEAGSEEELEEGELVEQQPFPPSTRLTDADIRFRELPLESPVQLLPLTYEDTNGQLNSFLQHNFWWAKPSAFDKLVIQNPQRLSDRDDKQFEAMIRLAEQAPLRTLKSDPGSVSKPMKKKLDEAMTEMTKIVKASHKKVAETIARPSDRSQRPFDLNSITLASLATQRGFADLKPYHKPQLSVAYERSFLQSLDKSLPPLPIPQQALTKEVAREELTTYIRDLQTLEHVDSFLLRPILALQKPRFRSRDGLVTDAHFVDLDSVELHKLWKPVQKHLEKNSGRITPLLWSEIVLRAVKSGTLVWTGKYWSPELAELLLRYMQQALTIMQLYDDVVSFVISQVEDEIARRQLDEAFRENEIDVRLEERGLPFALEVRIDPYALGVGAELLDEMVLNAFYGMEHDAAGDLTPIVQEVEGEEEEQIEPLRLLPLFEPDLTPAAVERATEKGAASFDRQSYTAGSFNYVTKILITRRQADVLGSSNLDQKVLRFRAQLVAALERYREVNKRTPLLQARRLPGLIGHDLNTIMCRVATHLRKAETVDISQLLKTAVAAFPMQHGESRRSRRIAEFLFYFALAEKMFLFDNNYLERPAVEFEKKKEEEERIVPRSRHERRLLEFLEQEAEEAVPEEEEEEIKAATGDVTLAARQLLMEKRLLRVAAELYMGSNSLSRFRANPDPDKRAIVNQGLLLEQQYRVGLNAINETLVGNSNQQGQFQKYEAKWSRDPSNVQTLNQNKGNWPLTMLPEQQDPNALQQPQTVLLKERQIIDNIPFVEDLATGGALTQLGLRNAFYSAVSVRDLMERGRQALPDAPEKLSTPYPLLVDRGSGVDVKERALRVALQFLLSGYLLPSNVDSLAAGLTVIQLMRLLYAGVSAGEDMLRLLTPLVEKTFTPSLELSVPQQQFSCALTFACMQRDAAAFQHLLYYASVQDIRAAGVLTLQLDYWMLEGEAAAVVDDIKTELVDELLKQLLDRNQLESYNRSVEDVNEVVKNKTGKPPLLRGPTDKQFETRSGEERTLYDYRTEADYDSLTLEQLQRQVTATPPAVVYTPWMSSLKALRLALEQGVAAATGAEGMTVDQKLQLLCTFIETGSGSTLNRYYRHSGCDRDVIVDLRADEGLSPLTFSLLTHYSLLYEDENYDSKLEAVMAYFSLTSRTILTLHELLGTDLIKSRDQRNLWMSLVSAIEKKPKPKDSSEAEAQLAQLVEEMTEGQRNMLITLFQIQTQSNLRELRVGADQRLHVARAGEKRPYEGYILLHERVNLQGEQVTLYTPIYPKYRRMLQRLLSAIKTAQKNKTHWLEEWSPQYRPHLLLTMRQKEDGSWKVIGRPVEPALTMRDIVGRENFEDLKALFEEPPLRPSTAGGGEFLGYGKGSKDPTVFAFRQQLKLITFLMELPQEFSGLGMLNFFIPDTRLGSVYDPLHFNFDMETMNSISLLKNIAPTGLRDYFKTHTPQQAEADTLRYIRQVHALFQRALQDLDQGQLTTAVRQVAQIVDRELDDRALRDDVENSLEEITSLEGFVVALRYPFNQPPALHEDHIIINHIIPELTEKEPAVQRVGRDVYQASFLVGNRLTIPGPTKARTRIVEEEEPIELTEEASEEAEEAMELVEDSMSDEMRELMESMEEE